VTPLVRTPAITVERFEHEPGVVHRDPEQERAAGHAVSFVETGSYRLRVAGAWRDVTPDHIFAATPGLEFACRHDHEHPQDRCLSVRYADAAMESLRSAGATPATTPVLRLTNRSAYLKHELAGAGHDAARTEAIAGALYWSLATPATQPRSFRPRQLSWYAARIDRAKEMMAEHYSEPLSLSRMAREIGMSLYHFARVFGELEGEPPHHYLVRVRLRHAATRLREGAGVTDTCYAVGFGSLSHFISTFRRQFGVRPSELRRPRPGR
jgi:AraC family transcriptional regulator